MRRPLRFRQSRSLFGEDDTGYFTASFPLSQRTMISYNLLEKPWIPVLQTNGHIRDVGLREFLERAHELREVAHDSPLFVASMLAISTALLQRVWRGESFDERDEEWTRLWRQGRFDDDFFAAYFARWNERFDLFHPRFPFYQTAGMEVEGESDSLFRLALEENNAGMFANQDNPDWVNPPPSLAAQLLVTIQNFSVGLGRTSNAKVGSEILETPYFASGPLMGGLTIWPSGATWFETLLLNLVPHELNPDDKPCWEWDVPHELRDKQIGKGREMQPVRGICDLLTVQSRLIRLLPIELDGQVVVPSAYFTQGRSLPKTTSPTLHPFKLYQPSKETGLAPLPLSENKAIWRNSSAIFDPASRKHDELNTLAFVAKQARDGELGKDFRAALDVVGIATQPGKAAKLVMWRHDRLPLPPALLTDENIQPRVEAAIEDADKLAEEMRLRFASVARTLLIPEKLGAGSGSPDPDDVKNLVAKFDPRRAFWPILENHFYELLRELPFDAERARALWRKRIEETANDCFGASCRALGNGPNAVVAVAQAYPLFSIEKIELFAGQNAAKAKAKADKKGAVAAA